MYIYRSPDPQLQNVKVERPTKKVNLAKKHPEILRLFPGINNRAKPSHSYFTKPISTYRPNNQMAFNSNSIQLAQKQYQGSQRLRTRLNRSYSSCLCFNSQTQEGIEQVYVSPSNVVSKQFIMKEPRWNFCQKKIEI